ncbi:hypothetical protein QFZ82_001399 [Streptomyces sp. V4I23]|uniref:hypothetical protein n=1 Tax=Streptomyces sp. V4I23 TaxID=3042282 RepID=UPI00278669A0|nr:hypothetical protein [Streptomyces sp. V4I23]MDQ1006914.1 hypothetical protein [Streptomyces sp. V4I23]
MPRPALPDRRADSRVLSVLVNINLDPIRGACRNEEGGGWKQVVEQLSFERGGAERVLSGYPVLVELIAASGARTGTVNCVPRSAR